MNWFTLALVFHVLKLSVCIAYNQVCPDGQYLNASGVCVNCSVCKQPDKSIIIRPCSSRADTICGSVSDLKVNLPAVKKPKHQLDFAYKFLDLNAVADLSKVNISTFLSKHSKTPSPLKTADKNKDLNYYYDYEDEDDDEDYEGEEISDSSNLIKTNDVKINTKNVDKPVKKAKSKIPKDFPNLKDSLLELSMEPSKNGKQIKKDLNINALELLNKTGKPIKYSVPKYTTTVEEELTVIDLDSLKKKLGKDAKKSKSKKKDKVEVNDHSLKIANTKFVIDVNADDKGEEGRWLHLSHPHIVDEKIYVDLANDNTMKDKKASTFFSSSEKVENHRHDREYENEMNKLLNETSSVLKNVTDSFNQTIDNKAKTDGETLDNLLKNLDDEDDDDDDDEDDEDSDEEEDDDDEDDKDDDEDDDDDEDSDDYNLIYNNVFAHNATNKSPENVEKVDVDLDDDYDLSENDNPEDKKWYPGSDVNVDIIAEPFVSTANWQILILVSAMSACLLFFIVVSTYVCLYMRKRRQFKTNFEADVEDLSVRVNLMQHAGFEADDTSNIKNYITQLRGVKSNNEKLPKLCTGNK